MLIFMLLGVLLAWGAPVGAATYYIGPSGNDSNSGTSTAAPWKTWTKAMASSGCGDTVLAMDGSYTVPANGSLIVTKNCSASALWTVQAINERKAWINNDNTNFPIRTLNASYIAFIGLHISTVDRSGTGFSTVQFRSSHHITFKRNLVQYNNRYGNTHMVELYGASDCLIEENEVYDFHRHGIIVEGGSRNVIRRNYVNARSRDAIPGGYNGTSGDNGSGDDAFILYPGDNSIIENNIADGQFSKAFSVEAVGSAINNKWLGNINNGGDKGLEFDARGSTTGQMPNNNYAENFVSINPATGLFGPGSGREGFYSRAARGITCKNCTIMGAPSYGFLAADNNGSDIGDGIYGLTLLNTLAMNATSGGYSIPGTIDSWSGTNVNAYNNSGAAYNPSSSSNWISKFTTDPQMGTCTVYRPDGSNAKTNNWGADILYRYVDGALTTIPLWDPITGKFPAGAVIAGVNDISGSSAFDIHIRLRVNSGGCAFPASYGGGGGDGGGGGGGDGGGPTTPPSNPPTHHVFTGTGAMTGTFTVPSGLDALGVFLLMRDSAGNVDSLASISSSCGGQAFTFRTASIASGASKFHDMEGWTLQNPISGSCTMTANRTGVGGMTSWIMDIFEVDNTAGFNAAAGNNGISVTPNVTVATNPDDTIYSATSGRSDAVISAGADQTLLFDQLLDPTRMAVSSQSGADGGVMDYVQAASSYWAMAAMSFKSSSPGIPSASTFEITNYRINGLHGVEGTPEITLGPLALANTPASIGLQGAFRIRVEILVETADSTSTGIAVYCRKNGGSYAQITNDFGTNIIKYYGPGAEPTIPATLTPTTQQLTATAPYVAGSTGRDQTLPITLPAMAVNSRTELDFQFLIGNGAVPGDVGECEIRRDDGSTLGIHTVLPTFTVITNQAMMGF